MMLYLGSTATTGQVQVLENPIRENIVLVLNLFSFRCWLAVKEVARMGVREE